MTRYRHKHRGTIYVTMNRIGNSHLAEVTTEMCAQPYIVRYDNLVKFTKIPVKHYERISTDEFTLLADGNLILARDVVDRNNILMWNGKKRIIKKIDGKWYLVTNL